MPKNKSGRVPDHEKLFEDLLEAKQNLDSKNMHLAHENASLKIAMSCKEASWKKEKESMQNADYEKLKEELQLDLKDAKKELRLQEKDYRSLSTRCQSQQAEIHKIRHDLKQRCNHVNELEYSIKQREQVIDRTVHEKMALEEEINELTTKLKAMGTKVLQSEPDWQSEIKALKHELSREQAEKEAGSSRIKELERQLKVTEEKWVTKHEARIVQTDQLINSLTSQNRALEASNKKLLSMQQAMEARILQNKNEWETKVNTLEDHLSWERVEKEAGSNRIKELERQLKVTEEKWVTKHEARIVFTDQVINSLTSQNMALEASNKKLLSMQQAIEARILQNKTEWEKKVNTLEDHLSSEQAEKEDGFTKIKELEKLVSNTEQMWAAKHEADIKLLILKQIKLQELALMTDKDKARIQKEQKKAKKEAQKRQKKELQEKKKQEQRDKLDREKEERRQKK
ncbi:calponin homology domain-containing protein DDB_G0272472-like [Paralichthys olivaceus]|uniref:calponin homology domain-containing protein DDB_G0272472-like n=1 Tax=Paralichthys olivaceus TaxID=8255 RepID=UPI003753C14A